MTITATTLSLRQRILNAMEEAFKAVALPDVTAPGYVAGPDDYPFEFSVVEQGPLGDADSRKRYCVGIVPVSETETATYPFANCELRVAIEFRVTVNQGDPKPAKMIESMLTVVKRVVASNRTWGGLAIDTKFVGNEIDMSTYGDKFPTGVMFCMIQYRHMVDEPRSPEGGF